MTTWQEVARTSMYGTYSEWREVYEELERAELLKYWEYAVGEPRRKLGLGPSEVERWAWGAWQLEQPRMIYTEEDFDRLAGHSREQRRRLLREHPDVRRFLICLAAMCGVVVLAILAALL